MKLLLFLAFASCLSAATLTPSGPATGIVGQPVSVSIALSGSSGLNLATFGWTLTPQTGMVIGIPSPGAAASAASKSVYSPLNPFGTQAPASSSNGAMIVAGTGGPQALSDGVLVTVPLTFSAAGTYTVSIASILVSNTSGLNVNGTTVTGTYTVTITNPCAVTGDAAPSVADIGALINAALGLTACSFPGFPACGPAEITDVEIAANGGSCNIH